MTEQLNIFSERMSSVKFVRNDDDELHHQIAQHEKLKTEHEAMLMSFRGAIKTMQQVKQQLQTYLHQTTELRLNLQPGGMLEATTMMSNFFRCEVPMCNDVDDPRDCTCKSVELTEERLNQFMDHINAHEAEVSSMCAVLESLNEI